MRSPRWLLAAVVGSVALVGAAPSTASAASAHHARSAVSVTGNAATIAFYKKVVRATDAEATQTVEFNAAGTMMRVKFEPGGQFSYDGAPKPGYQPMVGAIWVSARAGRVRFVAETLVCGRTNTPPCTPFGLVLTPKGVVVLGGSGDPLPASNPSSQYGLQPCSGSLNPGSTVGAYSKTGVASGYGLYGHFLPMRRSGDTVTVTSTYLSGRQRAIEVDTISATTYLPSRTVVHYAAAPGVPAFVVAYSVAWSQAPISPPNSNGICATYFKSIS